MISRRLILKLSENEINFDGVISLTLVVGSPAVISSSSHVIIRPLRHPSESSLGKSQRRRAREIFSLTSFMIRLGWKVKTICNVTFSAPHLFPANDTKLPRKMKKMCE
jgi:hypothetical protein